MTKPGNVVKCTVLICLFVMFTYIMFTCVYLSRIEGIASVSTAPLTVQNFTDIDHRMIRIEYYMQNFTDKTVTISKQWIIEAFYSNLTAKHFAIVKFFLFSMGTNKPYPVMNNKVWNEFKGWPYTSDIFDIYDIILELNISNSCDNIMAILGDEQVTDFFKDLPIFVKSRYISIGISPMMMNSGILWDFKHERHFGRIEQVNKHDILWENKMDKIVYRGSYETNHRTRIRHKFVTKYYDINNSVYDIAFTKGRFARKDLQLLKKRELLKYENYTKDKLSVSEQLEYKYIVSIEGNDVATGLKWQLYSNSVVFMPKARIESWAMEGKLKEYEHYIPLQYDHINDEWNLYQQYKWCLSHDIECKQIALNGKKWIQQFLNATNEIFIKKEIVNKYCHNFKFIN